ncbi:MAG: serine/threonine-protein kinase [Planctomycetota bacterium]
MADDADEFGETERLAAEFSEAMQSGDEPSVEDYVAKHPGGGPELRELLLTIQAMDQLKQQKGLSQPLASEDMGAIPRLGDFRIVREIGRGGMGVVYEAIQESLGRTVAVKVLPKQHLGKSNSLARFQQEAKTAARLHHTNIVPVLGVGEDDGCHYYVMQFVRGVGLDEVIRHLGQKSSDGSFDSIRSSTPAAVARVLLDKKDAAYPETPMATSPELEAARLQSSSERGYWQSIGWLMHRVSEAIQYAHDKEILHRDIKPSNLLVDASGNVSVADFGLAKSMDEAGLSRTGDVVGTLRYMAPEQLVGDADKRSDVYALGVTLYELATLRPAFDDDKLARALAHGERPLPDRPSAVRSDLPSDLETIIHKSIDSEPERRYQSAGELAIDLLRFCEDRPILARRSSSLEQLSRWSRRNPAIASLCGIAAVLLIAVAAVSTTAYYRTNLARQDAIEQRNKADRTSEAAFEAFDEIFSSLAPMPLVIAGGYPDVNGNAAPSAAYKPTKQNAALLENLLGFYEQIAEDGTKEPRYQRRLADANRRIGDIHQRLGQMDLAIEAYRRSEDFYEGLTRPQTSPDVIAKLAAVYNEVGNCMHLARRQQQPLPSGDKQVSWSSGTDEYWTALRLLEPLADVHSPPEVRYELAHTYFLLADTPRSLSQAMAPVQPAGTKSEGTNEETEDAAARMLRNASEILESLVANQPMNPSYRRLQAMCFLERSKELATGSLESEQLRKDAVDLLEALALEFPGNPDYQFSLASAYASGRVNSIQLDRDSMQAYIKRLRRAEAMLAELREEYPSSIQFFLAQLKFFRQRGALHRRLDGPGADLETYREAASVCLQAKPDVVNNITFKAVIETYSRAASLLLTESGDSQQDWETAVAFLKSGIAEIERLENRTDSKSDLTIREQFETRLDEAEKRLAGLEHRQ